MRTQLIVPALLSAALCAGCSSVLSRLGGVPQSLGEKNSGFTYIPLDPLSVDYPGCEAKPNGYDPLLDQLPDNSVRIATKKLTSKSEASFGVAGLGLEGEEYRVVLDYVNVDNTNIPFSIGIAEDWIDDPGTGERTRKVSYKVQRLSPTRTYQENYGTSSRQGEDGSVVDGVYVIPVYVGVGLRLTAEITVIKGSVNLSSLPSIAASVEAGAATGSLVVQTLGCDRKTNVDRADLFK